MKKLSVILTICACMLFSATAFAGHAHYVNGIEGVKGASVPPPGKYWRSYNVFYNANTMRNNNGDKSNFNVDVFATVQRYIHTTNTKILGADLVVGAIVPLTYTHVKTGGTDFNLGDIFIEPAVLAWHGERSDSVLGIGVYLPTGKFNSNAMANAGKGYWTYMLTAGTTQYLSADKSWSFAILARYEFHSSQRNTDYRAGDDFHFEWGLGKKLNDTVELGLAGYCQWQVRKDKNGNYGNNKERVYAIGPEINLNIPKWKAAVNIRSLWEFGAKNTTEGTMSTLTFTKAI